MKGLKLARTFHEGWHNVRRDGWLTLATVTIMTLSLYVLSITALLSVAAYVLLVKVQDRVNISAYFNPDVSEQEILAIKSDLEKYREIKSVDYISRDQALADFLKSEGDDPAIQQAINEIGENPLLASLVVRAQKADHYDVIAEALDNAPFREKISRINYTRNKGFLEQLHGMLNLARNGGLALSIIFAVVAVLITFNTIRMSMYAHRQEFDVMHLVGASNLYVRMPSFFEGIFYGLAGALVTLVLLALTAFGVAELAGAVFPQGSVLSAFLRYLWLIFLGVVFAGVGLGTISSFIAIRRYLEK